jgi:hypothetical protein
MGFPSGKGKNSVSHKHRFRETYVAKGLPMPEELARHGKTSMGCSFCRARVSSDREVLTVTPRA